MPETNPQMNPQMLASLGGGGGAPPAAPGPAGPAGLTPEILQMILPILFQILQANPQLFQSLMGAGGPPAGEPPMPMPGAGPGEGGESELLASLGIPGRADGGTIQKGQSVQVGPEIVTAQQEGGATVMPSQSLLSAILNNRTNNQLFAPKGAVNPTQGGAPNAPQPGAPAPQVGPTKEQLAFKEKELLHNSIPPKMLETILAAVGQRQQIPQPPRVPQTPGAPGQPNLFQKMMMAKMAQQRMGQQGGTPQISPFLGAQRGVMPVPSTGADINKYIPNFNLSQYV